MTKVERTCPRCQLFFVSDKLDGLCPSCLLNNTLDLSETDSNTRAFWEDDPAPASDGHTFAHFEIYEEIGRGGMGTVYRARDLGTDRIVALKLLQAHHLDQPDLVRRFRSEVRAVSSLDHRHILPVHEVGECDGIPFFSMKLATGGSLASQLGQYLGRPREAAQLVAKIARGVQHAHEHGILHRDLKPGNILLDDAGEPYVCDFGLAKWIDDDQRLTITSAVLGTPHYIAPEQASGEKHLTIAADIYSIGAILYELLTGRPPFVGESVIETLRQASECTPAKPSSIVNHTPRDLETVCLKALEREPASRYKTASAFADDLENWLSGRPIHARPVNAVEQLWRWARRNPLPAALFAIIALAITTIAVGATISAIKIDRARTRAVLAEKDAREQLYSSLLAQARASRMTDQAGHRIEALAAIKKAAAIHPTLELRNEAIAALTLVDLKFDRSVKIRESSGQRCVIDQDLSTAAVATPDNNISIVSLRDGRLLQTLPGMGKPIQKLIHSGTRYLAAHLSEGILAVWDLADNSLIRVYRGHPLPYVTGYMATNCVFSADEKLLALGSPNDLTIVEVASGKEVARMPAAQITHLRFAHTGTKIAFASLRERSVKIWDYNASKEPTSVNLPSEPSYLAWSPDDETLAVGCSDFTIQLFDSRHFTLTGTLTGHRQEIVKLVFNHSGSMLASTSRDRSVRLWDPRTRSELVELPKYGTEQLLSFSTGDDQLCAIDIHPSIAFFSIVGLNRVCTTFPPTTTSDLINSASTVDFSPDSRIVATASTRVIQFYDVKNERFVQAINLPVQTQTGLRFLPDGRTLAVLSRRTGLSFYQYALSQDGLTLSEVKNNPAFATFALGSPNFEPGTPFTILAQNTMQIVEDRHGEWSTIKTYSPIDNPRDAIVLPETKNILISFGGKNAQLLDLNTGNVVKTLEGGHGGLISLSPSGRWVAYSGTGANHLLWNPKTWQPGPSLPPEVEAETSFFSFSPDETLLAATLYDQIALVTLPSGGYAGMLNQRIQPNPYSRLKFSPDNTHLAAHAIDNSLVIWNIEQLKRELRELSLSW